MTDAADYYSCITLRPVKDTPPQGTDCTPYCTPKQELNPKLKGRWAPLRSLHGCKDLQVEFFFWYRGVTIPGAPRAIRPFGVSGQSFSFFWAVV